MNLELACTGSDCSYNIDGNTFDEFQILKEGVPIFSLRFQWSGDDGKAVATLQALTQMSAAELPFVINDFHLIGLVNDRLIDLLNEREGQVDFFNDCFRDEEGRDIRQPFVLVK